MRLEEYFLNNAKAHPEKTAVVVGNRSYSYAALLCMVMERTIKLKEEHTGRFVVFRSSQTVDFIADYLAIHLSGKIAVPLEKNTPENVFAAITNRFADYNDDSGEYAVPEDVADVLFTTGTTGKQKGVMISHQTIIADAENLIDAQHFTVDLSFVISGPLNHIGSLSKLYPMIYLGGTIVITEGIKDMNSLLNAMETASGKVATFLVPASIRILMQFAEDKLRSLAHKIDFIETGAAAITQGDMERLCGLLPYSRLYNTYASTETGIVATYNFNDGECIAGCLGKPMRHSGIRISSDGHVACVGETLMTGYIGDAELTASVLFDDAVHTSDLGYIDDKGRLRLKGRDGDVINVGGYKVAPTEVENVAMAFPMVEDCVCIASLHPVLGTVLKLLVVPVDEAEFDKKKIALFLKDRLEAYKVPMQYEKVEKVNRTYNGKIDRKSYILS